LLPVPEIFSPFGIVGNPFQVEPCCSNISERTVHLFGDGQECPGWNLKIRVSNSCLISSIAERGSSV
jgi:hypothetical protein